MSDTIKNARPLPADLFAGISGDPYDVADARADRLNTLLAIAIAQTEDGNADPAYVAAIRKHVAAVRVDFWRIVSDG